MNWLKKLINKVLASEIAKVFSLNAVSTLIHMCTGLISTKVVASIIGPSGVALLGQLNNINSMFQGLAAGGIRGGLTKYIAEFKTDENKVKSYISNALKISTIFTLIISLICVFLHKFLSRKILLSDEYGYVFIILGITIYLFSLNSLLVSILNGYKEFNKYVVVNISASIFSLVFSVTLCAVWGLKGAMVSAVTFQSVIIFVTIYQCRKCSWFKISNFLGSIDRDIINKFLQYTLMAVVPMCISPISQMFLRGYVIREISPIEAGWWEAMNRISSIYLSVITTSMSVYILPRMSEITNKWELKQELIKYYKFIIPILLVCTVIIYALRHFIIWVLYTPEFYPMENLFLWQLVGDLFKMASWLLAYLMLAKAKTRLFISTEIIFGIIMLCFCYMGVKNLGTIGLNIGYMFNYIVYFITMVIVFKDILFCRKPKK